MNFKILSTIETEYSRQLGILKLHYKKKVPFHYHIKPGTSKNDPKHVFYDQAERVFKAYKTFLLREFVNPDFYSDEQKKLFENPYKRFLNFLPDNQQIPISIYFSTFKFNLVYFDQVPNEMKCQIYTFLRH